MEKALEGRNNFLRYGALYALQHGVPQSAIDIVLQSANNANLRAPGTPEPNYLKAFYDLVWLYQTVGALRQLKQLGGLSQAEIQAALDKGIKADPLHPLNELVRILKQRAPTQGNLAPVPQPAAAGGGQRGGRRGTWPRHHPFPMYLGGAIDQTLRKIPPSLHYLFHSELDKWMNGKYARSKGADYFTGMSRDEIIKDLREFYKKAASGIFRRYLPDFEQAVKESSR